MGPQGIALAGLILGYVQIVLIILPACCILLLAQLGRESAASSRRSCPGIRPRLDTEIGCGPRGPPVGVGAHHGVPLRIP